MRFREEGADEDKEEKSCINAGEDGKAAGDRHEGFVMFVLVFDQEVDFVQVADEPWCEEVDGKEAEECVNDEGISHGGMG